MDFERHKASFLAHLASFNEYLPYEDICYNPYPLVVAQSLYRDMMQLSEVLMKALRAVADNYLHDADMQSTMPLDHNLQQFLVMSSNTHFLAGTMRPDLLFGKAGEIKLCEINARFPLNGMTMSQWLNNAAYESDYLVWERYHPVSDLTNIKQSILKRFNSNKALVRVATSEKGGESRYFLQHFSRSGAQVLHAQPEELQFKQGCVFSKTLLLISLYWKLIGWICVGLSRL